MAPILKVHKITFTDNAVSKLYYFLANPKTYVGIGTDTGVSEATDAEQGEALTSVAEILGAGYIVRAKIYYKAGGKRKSAHILIPSNKFTNFRKEMPGKTYGTRGIVTSIKQPRRATFY